MLPPRPLPLPRFRAPVLMRTNTAAVPLLIIPKTVPRRAMLPRRHLFPPQSPLRLRPQWRPRSPAPCRHRLPRRSRRLHRKQHLSPSRRRAPLPQQCPKNLRRPKSPSADSDPSSLRTRPLSSTSRLRTLPAAPLLRRITVSLFSRWMNPKRQPRLTAARSSLPR